MTKGGLPSGLPREGGFVSQRDPSLRRTPLFERHERLGAKIGPFAGYAMPITYGSIADEHHAVRTSAGLFDVSHMGRLVFRGEAGVGALERLVAIHAPGLPVGRARYGFVLTDEGGVLDDVILYALSERERLLVVNAGNRAAVIEHFRTLEVAHSSMSDETDSTGMVALQGPAAREVLGRVMPDVEPPGLSQRVITAAWEGARLVLATTGYTGEDGVELIAPAGLVGRLWERLCEAGASPAGLGARDTLRLEMGYPLHGHELSTEITPWQAGLAWALDLRNTAFCGRDRLLERQDEPTRQRVGLRSEGRGVPRAGQEVFHDGTLVGKVTSGTFSPSLRVGVAMAYVDAPLAKHGTRLTVLPPGSLAREAPVEVVPLPFYRRGSRRSSRER